MSSSVVADLGKKLLEASRKGNAEEVRQLMANGAPITTDWLGTSPLHLAAQYGHTVTAEVLLRAGVSRDGKTKVDKTPLHLAAQQGHFEIAQMLVKCGATINATDMLTMTPLHWAVEARSEAICKLLMEHGARADIKNKFGRTAVEISRSKAYDNILTILTSVAYVPHENGGKRYPKSDDSFFLESKKRARTRKFPMTAGSWTVGEMQTVNEKDERLRPKEPRMIFPNCEAPTTTRTLKVVSAEGSNLSSLVDAADIVRSKVKYPSDNEDAETEGSNEFTEKDMASSETSILDTLATLATASTQMATAVSDSNQQAHKVASIPNQAVVAPSYVTIPGIPGPVSIIQANPNQPGLVQQVASALPPGMIQLASPLAFNILPGGRIQIGQSVLPGHPLGMPLQMPIQPTPGIPAGQLVAVSSGQSIAVVGGLPPGHILQKPLNVTDTTPSRHGVVMSPVSQGVSPVLSTSTITPTPQQLPSSAAPSTFQSESVRHSEARAPSSANFCIQPSIIPHQQQAVTPSPITPPQVASAFQYANLGPGITPIPLVPVAGVGGIQLVPQAMLQTHLLNAFRAGIPQSPGLGAVQPQVVTPGGAYTIPVSPLNLSSILPTALSLSQIPLSQQTINSLAQQSMVNSLSVQSVANALAQQNSGAHNVLGSQSQGISLQNDLITSSTTQQQHKRVAVQNGQTQMTSSTNQQNLPFTSGAHINLVSISSQPHLATVLTQQAFGAHHNISVTELQHSIANNIAYHSLGAQSTVGTRGTSQNLPISAGHLTVSTQADTDIESLVRPHMVSTTSTTKSDGHAKQSVFHDSNKDNALLSHLTIATVESRSPSLIVNSSHSPRMPISPGNFVRNEEEMQGISPSQISPTKTVTQSIFTSADDDNSIVGNNPQVVTKSNELNIIASSSPFNDATSQRPLMKDSNTVTYFTGDHVLPHLHQLIYKQLLQQQQQNSVQQQQHSNQDQITVTGSQSPAAAETEAVKEEEQSRSAEHDETPSHDFVNQSRDSPSDEFEGRSHEQQSNQSEYFWREIENPGLKRHLETELDANLYHDDFGKGKSHGGNTDEKNDGITALLIKDEHDVELTNPPENVNRSSGKVKES